ncbi:TonB-dependent receptor [Paraflavitalea sp. CAU 1676]|uniref:TonB-dependent receptor domain-containing protein n=1 Tax=Paraflavitalea sp. CAU 1676 TaxID=3032598 RepID=UPI0023DB343F|nr:TonB-dependent receptor [Paraflavitalea sp. CAU 1676]MDF2191988.1 TonB-dependent receptor [Paraflavitalea sp. CAU 1676]
MTLIYRSFLLIFSIVWAFSLQAQESASQSPGIITGNILDEKQKAIGDATVELQLLADTLTRKTTLSDKNGNFSLSNIAFGYYRLKITYVGFQPMVIDSMNFRTERFDFNMNDLVMKSGTSSEMAEVVVYAEKPLIQSRDGNITFNAGESALSAGSTASELLKSVPLVANDPDGKVVVRGKEPKILIDDKPVDLNAQQLQDFLESLPGSMIERIEVMTNPPPQYANEQGGVINIITRKGRVGAGARLSLTAGTNGERNISGNINYRKKGLSINLNVNTGDNRVNGYGYSKRENLYKDSTNYFNSTNSYRNRNTRPGARLSIDYDIDRNNIVNVLLLFNHNDFRNRSENEYTNLNQHQEIYKLSNRYVETEGQNVNPAMNLTYTHRGKKPGETLRLIAGANYSYNQNDRTFFQQFLFPDRTPTGVDSTQQQLNDSWNHGYSVRVNYDKLLDNKSTSFSVGGGTVADASHVVLNTQYWKKPDNVYVKSDLLSNDFGFKQSVHSGRFSMKQIISEQMSVTAGVTAEVTDIKFDLKDKTEVNNDYTTWLPFANFNQRWEEVLNLSVAYRKTIRRPGIGQLNPSIDYGDPNNIRYGNPELAPTTAHNFDLVLGRNGNNYYTNLGFGYNVVQSIFSQIRNLLPDGKTETTWQNIDDRHEYEVSTWSGYTLSKRLRMNASASYTFNKYSEYDKTKNKYRDGGSFTTSFNANYSPLDVWNFNGNFTLNRFANPQGTVRSNVRMNLSAQYKLLKKKLILTLNAIDPIFQQKYTTYTFGPNYNLESFSNARTRSYRLTVSYNFTNLVGGGKKKPSAAASVPVKGGAGATGKGSPANGVKRGEPAKATTPTSTEKNGQPAKAVPAKQPAAKVKPEGTTVGVPI